ncbi:MAG: 4Fe-4S binding protein [Clostridium sp.]|nr:4Fe-4S binding protein [Clostridium sp.]
MSKKELKTIKPDVKWNEITPGGVIDSAGNAHLFKTGDWRSMKPVWNSEKCKNCLLCYPVCPDSSILIKDGKMVGIDYDHCKGCGVCAKVCPFKAIDFVEEA